MTKYSSEQEPDQIVAMAKALQVMFSEWEQGVREVSSYWKVHTEGVTKTFQGIFRTVATLPDDLRENGKFLAQRGWYVDLDLPFAAIRAAASDIKNGNAAGVDDYFAEHYTGRLSSIEFALAASHPSRRIPLEQAFGAHRDGQYALSVPVFLAQAEGICCDTFGGKLFQKRNGRPQVADAIDAQIKSEAASAFLSVLALPGGVTANEQYRPHFPDCLNRHEILHGIDPHYGSKLNSLRAVSLLTFVGILSKRLLDSEAKGAA